MNRFLAAFAMLSLAVSGVAAPAAFAAEKCRDTKGKFIKCPVKPAAAAGARCKDAKGKFAKCGTAGAVPVK